MLRAGSKARTDADAEGCLTRTLKRTSLVPTGACLPRNFDPDYCAYDGYYAIGVALVSTALGFLLDNGQPLQIYSDLAKAFDSSLGEMCHTRKDGWFFYGKRYSSMNNEQKGLARDDFPMLCKALNAPLIHGQVMGVVNNVEPGGEFNLYNPFESPSRLEKLRDKLLFMLFAPAAGVVIAVEQNMDSQLFYSLPWWAAFNLQHIWILKYIARFMNEHAMMIASFFRVNAKRLRASEPLLTDLKAFAQQCKEDIADGPNPPPPPPTAEELAAARADAEVIDEVMKMPTIMASYE